MTEEIEKQACECCEKEIPFDDLTMQLDMWMCNGCYSEWKKEFDACNHVWIEDCQDADEGRYCSKCSGFVTHEDVAAVSE